MSKLLMSKPIGTWEVSKLFMIRSNFNNIYLFTMLYFDDLPPYYLILVFNFP